MLAMAAAGWFARDRLAAQYYVYRITHAQDAELHDWIDRASAHAASVEPILLSELSIDDAAHCQRAGSALLELHRNSSAEMASLLLAQFQSLSPASQAWAIQQAGAWTTSASNQETCRRLIDRALHSETTAIRL